MSRRQFDTIIRRASKAAFEVAVDAVKKELPSGWRISLMVGWGFNVDDESGRPVVGRHGTDQSRLNKKQKAALEMLADYCDIFGYDNTVILL